MGTVLASKSKLMDATVPRNELSAILLCNELAFLVKRALRDLVDEIIYCTIALFWCMQEYEHKTPVICL